MKGKNEMKKLMLAAALCCAAIVAQAGDCTYVINAGAYNGYKIQCTQVSTEVEEVHEEALTIFKDYYLDQAAWQQTGATSWAEHYAAISSSPEGIEYTSTIANGKATAKFNESTLLPYQSAAYVLFKDGIVPGGEYLVMKTLYDTTENETFDFANVEVYASGNLKTDGIPEPTSAMLMLLGVAGLALKRKQK